MLNRYEKILKREIRNSRKFYKNSEINIISVNSTTKDFALGIIKRLNDKFSLNFKINLIEYQFLEDIELMDNSILILPIEGVFVSFFMYNLTKDEKYKKMIKRKDNFYNIAYSLSEFYIAKYLEKSPKIFCKNEALLRRIYDLVSINEKFISGLENSLEFISRLI